MTAARAYLIKPNLALPWAQNVTPSPSTIAGATVAVREGEPKLPEWEPIVAAAVFTAVNLNTMTGPGATVFLPGPVGEPGVAFCFGSGRYNLASGSWIAGFGMRATLNAAARTGPSCMDALLAVSYSTIEESPVSGTIIGAEGRGLAQFAIDAAVDRIRGVRATGVSDALGVGGTLEGSTSLRVEVDAATDLVSLAGRLREIGTATDYKQHWAYLDDFIVVEDLAQRDELNEALRGRLAAGNFAGVGLDYPHDLPSGLVRIGQRQDEVELTLALIPPA